MKRMGLLLIFMVLVTVCLVLPPTDAQAASESDLIFELNSDGQSYCVATCISDASGELIIPTTYKGKPVTSIGIYAFEGCTGLTQVTIPDSVTSIGDSAFYGCAGLTNITIPVSVKTIGRDILWGCSSLESMTIPFANLAYRDWYYYTTGFGGYFGQQSYAGSTAILQSLTEKDYPDSASSSSTGKYFYIPSSLKSVTVVGGSITTKSFANCSMLTNITVGDSADVDMGSVWYGGPFSGCTNLETITVSKNHPVYSNDAFGALFDKDMTTLIAVPMTINNYVIPNSVTRIGKRAFSECNKLKSITIPDSVIAIDWQAFYGCNNLSAVFYRGTNSQKEGISIAAACQPLTDASWHYNVEDADFGGQNCYYCVDCNDYYLPTGEFAFATITFLDWDGTKLSEEKVRYNTAVTIPENPTRQHMQSNIYEYVFTGWDKEIAASCTGNATYAAQYASRYIDYTITFKNWDDTILSVETYHWGDVVAIPNPPTKAANNIYTYTFAGWDSDVVNCAGNATYKATFFSDYIDYKVVFKNWDDTILSSQTYHWGEAITEPETPAKEADNIYTYMFNGWDNPVTVCAGNTTYTAAYTPIYIDYTITFKNWNGDVVSSETYHYGDTVTAPTNPAKASDNTYSYTFVGWDKTVVNCAGDATYTATYTSAYINYTVVFKDWNGSVLSSQTCHWGDKVTVPTNPVRAADNTYTYAFKGWDKNVVDCVGDTTYTATYTSSYIDYTVVFKNWNGDVLSTKTYHYGEKVEDPADPIKEKDDYYKYSFIGWDKDVVNCIGNAEYTAVFQAAHYHTYAQTVTPPTCTEKGYTTHTCDCGDTYTDTYVDVLGHKMGAWETTKDNTCTEEGSKRRDCDHCDYFETDVVSASGHSHNAVVTAPTCTDQGYTTHTCQCGDTYVDSYVDELGHNMGQWECVNATCTKDGKNRRDCSRCDHYETESIPATGHSYTKKVVAPTYTKQGYTQYTCHCGHSYKNSYKNAKGLPAPSVKIANDAKTGKPSISWKAVSEASSYVVYRATAKSGSYSKLATVTKTSYTDSSAALGKTYYYKVIAVCKSNSKLNSKYSAIVSAVAKCGQPTIKVSVSSKGKVTVSWGKVSGAKEYDVYYATSQNGTYKKLTSTTKTSYSHTKASAGKEYFYKVRAYSTTATTGAFSNVSRAVIKLATPNVTVANTTTGVKVSWNKITGAKTYAVYKSVNTNGKWSAWKAIKTGVTSTSFTDTSVKSNDNVKYTVRAVNSSYISSYKGSAAIKFLKNPTVKAANAAKGVSVTWNKITGAKSYDVYRSVYSNGKWSGWTKIKTGVTGTSYTDTGVKSGATVKYTVRAVNSSYVSSYAGGNATKFLAQPTVKVAKASNGIKVTWGKISGASGYTVYRRTYSNGKWSGWTALKNTTAVSYTDTTAKKGVTYQYTVRAYSGSYKSSYTNSASIKR